MDKRTAALMIVLLALAAARDSRAVNCEHSRSATMSLVICRVDLRNEQLRLAYADAGGARYQSFEALRASLARAGKRLGFAMNAGMFHPDYRPVGLLVIDGQEISAINRDAGAGNFFLQPNGVLLVDGAARVLATGEYRGLKPQFATQSGPMLVHRGQISSSSAFRVDSGSRHIRNGVCVPDSGTAAFVISDSEVNFFEFARFFRETLRCDEALYLDGSISSLYAPQLQRADHFAALGPMVYVAE